MTNNKIFFIFKSNALKLLLFAFLFSYCYEKASLQSSQSNQPQRKDNDKSITIINTGSFKVYIDPALLERKASPNNNHSQLITDNELNKIKEKLISIKKETIFPDQASSTIMEKDFLHGLKCPYKTYQRMKVFSDIMFFTLSMILPSVILYYYSPPKCSSKMNKLILVLGIATLNTFCCKNVYDNNKENQYGSFEIEKTLQNNNINRLTHENINIDDEISYIGYFRHKEEFAENQKKTSVMSDFKLETIFPHTFPHLKYYIFAKKSKNGSPLIYYMRCWMRTEEPNDHLYPHPQDLYCKFLKKENNLTENNLALAYIYNFNLMDRCWKDLFYTWGTLNGFGEFLYKGLFNIPGRILLTMINFFNKNKN